MKRRLLTALFALPLLAGMLSGCVVYERPYYHHYYYR